MSQYRNEHIFYLIHQHSVLFGQNATWQYIEAGHGKGPYDGVGAVAKRMADDAVKHEKQHIQNASDFFAWADWVHQAIRYEFISTEQCLKAQQE